jgi:hypothetical protein
MKTYGEVEVWLHALLTSALDGGEWSTSRPSCFTPKERAPQYPFDWRLSGPQSQSGCVGEKKKKSIFTGNRNPVVQPAAWLLY